MIRLLALCALLGSGSVTCFGAKFDVLSVRAVESAGQGEAPRFTGGPNSGDPGRFHAHAGMFALLMKAFGVNVDQIVCPDWVRSGQHFYDIEATLPPSTSQSEFESMLQTMLEERFHMSFHRSQKSLPGYELRLVNRSRFEKSAAEPPTPSTGTMAVSIYHQRYEGHDVSMGEFTDYLGLILWQIRLKEGGLFFDPRPRIIDRTGLTGKYSFTLEYSSSSSASPGDERAGDSPDLTAALRIQLGLDLVKANDVPVDIITIEALEMVPAPN